jgi:hypothetical protein
MGTDSSTPSLFDQFPEQNGVPEPALSPSDKFRLENPNYVEPVSVERDWDPNARRSVQLEGVGGGLRAAVDGELQGTPVSVNKSVPVVVRGPKRRNYESRYGDSERSFGRPDYFDEPQLPTEEERAIGRLAIAKIREQQAKKLGK